MEFDTTTTAVAFVLLVLAGVAAPLAASVGPRTVLSMVLPSLVVFGLLALLLGVKHGEYRAGADG